MSSKHWIETMEEIADDFRHADVRQFMFKRVKGKTTCMVVVRNADDELITWELVDDGVSSDRWRKVSTLIA
jgi:hypothetical protein